MKRIEIRELSLQWRWADSPAERRRSLPDDRRRWPPWATLAFAIGASGLLWTLIIAGVIAVLA